MWKTARVAAEKTGSTLGMRWTSILMALAVVGGLAWWFGLRERPAPAAAEAGQEAAAEPAPRDAERPVPVMVLEVEAGQAENRLTVPGRTRANRRVDVAAETTGLVMSEPQRRGARVAEGDLLCRLDPGSRPAQLAEAEARLAEAEADARAAESLSAKGFTAETTRMTRQAELEAAQAAVDLIRLDIRRLEIRAPFAGVLETDAAELGSRLAPGETCATVVDLSTVRASGYVSEDVVDRIALGQAARVRLVNGHVAEGEVTFISAVADEDTRTYEVEVTLPNPDGRIRDGMTAEITIELPAERAHRLPQSALTLDDEGRLGVRLAERGRARFRQVSVLSDAPEGVWVLGLPERARVIVAGQEFVRDGRAIAPTPIGWDDLA
jgi:multidrug efflux system membrane fusion protein